MYTLHCSPSQVFISMLSKVLYHYEVIFGVSAKSVLKQTVNIKRRICRMALIDQALLSYTQKHKVALKNIVVCTHAKFSALELCRALVEANINVVFHPVGYSKEPQNLDKLHVMGIRVIENDEELLPFIEKADCALEDGARISKIIDQHKPTLKRGFFSVEQTSGGVRYFNEHPPAYPVIDVAMSPVKLDIENRRATPEGVIQHFSEATGKTLGGKHVLVLGFGSIGEGIARFARILGAHVTVYDQYATKRMFAKHRGYAIIEQDEFDHTIPKQDVIFTATNTYQGTALSVEQFLLMKDGAVICNAGSGRGEVGIELHEPGTYTIHDAAVTIKEADGHLLVHLKKGDLKKSVTVLARAFPINLHLGKGTSHDAIEVVMSLMLLAALHGPSSPTPGIQALSFDIQEDVALLTIRHDRFGTFEPRYVKTRQLDVTERPYGGVFPFHNDLSHIANHSVARAWFKTGTKTRGHYHRRTQEAYYAESGTADIILWHRDSPEQKVTHKIEPGDYLLVPENYFHDVVVTSDEDFECLVIATPPFHIWDQFFNKEEAVT